MGLNFAGRMAYGQTPLEWKRDLPVGGPPSDESRTLTAKQSPPTSASEVPGIGISAEGLLDAAPDGFMVADAAGKILIANKALEDLFGYTKAEFLELDVAALVPEKPSRSVGN